MALDGYFSDKYYYGLSDFKLRDSVPADKNSINLLAKIVETMMSLMKNKILIEDQLLLLAFQICSVIGM